MCPPKKGEPGNLIQIIDQLRGLRFGAIPFWLAVPVACVVGYKVGFAYAARILA